ncbi:MAG: hypothetical protein J6R96_06890 [Spirochaetaceae bacterium]|nr:hypothetical protein [Spirochaetaceae bacterium]
MTKGVFLILMILSFVSPVCADRHSSYYEKQNFYIEECEREDGKISIEFSIPVHPESVTRENIRINGLPLPENIQIFFNRRGDRVMFSELPQWQNETICIEISGLTSYLGSPMIPLPAFYLAPDDEFDWED